ncbi:MAG: EamA family transporter [Ferruginibacter sp.]
MMYLLGSIVLSSYLTIAFKLCDRFNINKLHAIVFNYLTCAVTGSLVIGAVPNYSRYTAEPWFFYALMMGALFFVTFNLIALAVQKSGLAVASVASKLSLIIPFTVSIFLYNETVGWMKIAGIILALVAVLFTLYPSKTNNSITPNTSTLSFDKIILPLIVFIGTGVVDTTVKYVQHHFITDANNDDYLISTFTAAFAVGFFYLGILLLRKKEKFQPTSVLAGIAIGIPNYFSIWCLVHVLKKYGDSSSVIIPVNNMGIVLFSAIVAWLFFREKLTRTNWFGIALSIAAILLIAFGK